MSGISNKPPDSKEVLDLVEANMGLAIFYARRRASKYISAYQDLADYIQIASIGLLEAARKYNPDSNVPFGSFAGCYIRGRLADDCRKAMTKQVDSMYFYTNTGKERDISIDFGDMTELHSKLVVTGFLSTLSEDYKDIVLLLLSGYSSNRIAKEMNCTQPNIWQKVDRIRRRWVEYTK
jgi:RNA polymerase sigma factor (sigma-70 family)